MYIVCEWPLTGSSIFVGCICHFEKKYCQIVTTHFFLALPTTVMMMSQSQPPLPRGN